MTAPTYVKCVLDIGIGGCLDRVQLTGMPTGINDMQRRNPNQSVRLRTKAVRRDAVPVIAGLAGLLLLSLLLIGTQAGA